MKNIFLALSFFVGFSSIVQAQNNPLANMTPEDRANRNTSMLTRRLNLTDDQSKQVKDILLNQAKAMDSIRSSGSGADMSGAGEAMMGVRKATDLKLNALFTDDQKKIYEEVKSERRKRAMTEGPPQN